MEIRGTGGQAGMVLRDGVGDWVGRGMGGRGTCHIGSVL